MTRRQFEALAALVKDYANNGGSVGWNKLAADLADLCKAENPRFNRDLFIAACFPDGFDADCDNCRKAVRHTHNNNPDSEQS